MGCLRCRESHLRCHFKSDKSTCMVCQKENLTCIQSTRDRRRRAGGRTHTKYLTERVAVLENLLRQCSGPDYTTSRARSQEVLSKTFRSPEVEPSLRAGLETITTPAYTDSGFPNMTSPAVTEKGARSSQPWRIWPRSLVSCIFNIESLPRSKQPKSSTLRVSTSVCQSIPARHTEVYLANLFWTHFHCVHPIIEARMISRNTHVGDAFYSEPLHMCALAIGLRYADKTRPDIRKMESGDEENALHRAARDLISQSIEGPVNPSIVAALILMGDLDCGSGRGNQGWLWFQMAFRFMLDTNMHSVATQNQSSIGERRIWHKVISACIMYDHHWSLLLGRRVTLAHGSIVTTLSQATFSGQDLATSYENWQAYQLRLELVAFHEKIPKGGRRADGSFACIGADDYDTMAEIDAAIGKWYAALPRSFEWTAQNISSAPPSYFHLHLQYHTLMIHIYQPFCVWQCGAQADNTIAAASRATCVSQALFVAEGFQMYRQRFDVQRCSVDAIMYAGSAVTTLLAFLNSGQCDPNRKLCTGALHTLCSVFLDLSETYAPAKRMFVLFREIIHGRQDEMNEKRDSVENFRWSRSDLTPYTEFEDEISHKKMTNRFSSTVFRGYRGVPQTDFLGGEVIVPTIESPDAEYTQMNWMHQLYQQNQETSHAWSLEPDYWAGVRMDASVKELAALASRYAPELDDLFTSSDT